MKKENVLYQCKDQWYPEYEVKVVQLKNPRHGKLTVSFNDEVFYTEVVPVSYGAPFGADVMDIQAWGHIACCVTDKHLAGRGIKSEPPITIKPHKIVKIEGIQNDGTES